MKSTNYRYIYVLNLILYRRLGEYFGKDIFMYDGYKNLILYHLKYNYLIAVTIEYFLVHLLLEANNKYWHIYM
jgi:hypothetical protein